MMLEHSADSETLKMVCPQCRNVGQVTRKTGGNRMSARLAFMGSR